MYQHGYQLIQIGWNSDGVHRNKSIVQGMQNFLFVPPPLIASRGGGGGKT